MEKIEITVKTAERLLEHVADWLEFVDTLDSETRGLIVALDELITALPNGEELLKAIEDEQRAQHAEMMRQHRERQEAEKAGKND